MGSQRHVGCKVGLLRDAAAFSLRAALEHSRGAYWGDARVCVWWGRGLREHQQRAPTTRAGSTGKDPGGRLVRAEGARRLDARTSFFLLILILFLGLFFMLGKTR